MAAELITLLNAIRQHIDEHGYPPSQREIARYANRLSPNTGHTLVRRLEAAGLIDIKPAMPRTLRITATGMAALTETV